MSSLYSLTYVSTFSLQEASDLMADAMLLEIGIAEKARNLAADLTGYLVFENGFFLQTIEGTQSAVEASYQSITRDPRHHSLVILHRGEIAERTYSTWDMSVSVRRGGQREVAAVVAYLIARATQQPTTPPDEYFRDFLAPSRAIVTSANRGVRMGIAPAPPTRIALCTNSAFWLMPTFNYIASRYDETPQSSKIVDPEGSSREPVALEYVDVNGSGETATRIIGVNDGLLTSPASLPLLSNLDLIVLLARAREGEDYLYFIGHLLSHRWVGRANPEIMLICPDKDAEFVPAITESATMQGFRLQILSGTPKAGDEIWEHIRQWLLARSPQPLAGQTRTV